MAKVTFEKPEKENDMVFYETMRLKAIAKIQPLTCPNDKESFVNIVIGAKDGRFKFKIVQSCCPKFLELAKKAVYPWAG
jgi:hypothetical protein